MTIDTQILRAFRECGEGSVSGAELAEELGVSRAAIWARIEELRSLGYEIDATPHQGYRLVSIPDVLHADDLLARMPLNQIIGRDIRVFEQTGSTNDIAEKLARDGAVEGVVVFAESQTRGRGRMGRQWLSPSRKGLWLSVLLRPRMRPEAATQITIAAATALARAIQRVCHLDPEIKWPNDLLLKGRKVAGILTEMSAELDRIKSLIVGVGVDVNVERQDLPAEIEKTATSLRIESGAAVNRADLATAYLSELDREYHRICAGEFAQIADEWESKCVTIGCNVSISIGNRQIVGRAESLDADGALMIRSPHGHLERIIGGDVLLEK